jgi:hypothetical protein
MLQRYYVELYKLKDDEFKKICRYFIEKLKDFLFDYEGNLDEDFKFKETLDDEGGVLNFGFLMNGKEVGLQFNFFYTLEDEPNKKITNIKYVFPNGESLHVFNFGDIVVVYRDIDGNIIGDSIKLKKETPF